MIRAVLDTNVFASALANFCVQDNVPAAILHAAVIRRFQLVTSDVILQELHRTLEKLYFRRWLSGHDLQEITRIMTRRAQQVAIMVHVSGVATHPEDDPILATALSAQVDYLVTGDRRLRDRVPAFHGIPLVFPAQFLETLSRES
jgi:putative PIN family toxin of toxin-antitoxin system